MVAAVLAHLRRIQVMAIGDEDSVDSYEQTRDSKVQRENFEVESDPLKTVGGNKTCHQFVVYTNKRQSFFDPLYVEWVSHWAKIRLHFETG